MTGEPGELYELHLERGEIELLAEPVLIIALDGYIDAGSGREARRRPPAVQPGAHRRRHLRRRPADRLPCPPTHPDLPVERLHRLPGAGAAGSSADRHRRNLVPAALRSGARQPVGALRRRRRPGRGPVRGPADGRPDGDPDGRAAHPADRDVLARHPQGAAPRAGGLARHHPGPGTCRRAAGVPLRAGRSGHHRLRRPRAALHRAIRLPGNRPHPDPGDRRRHRPAAADQRPGLGRRHRSRRAGQAGRRELRGRGDRPGPRAAVRRLRLGNRARPAGPVGTAADRRRAGCPVRGVPGRSGTPRQLTWWEPGRTMAQRVSVELRRRCGRARAGRRQRGIGVCRTGNAATCGRTAP